MNAKRLFLKLSFTLDLTNKVSLQQTAKSLDQMFKTIVWLTVFFIGNENYLSIFCLCFINFGSLTLRHDLCHLDNSNGVFYLCYKTTRF